MTVRGVVGGTVGAGLVVLRVRLETYDERLGDVEHPPANVMTSANMTTLRRGGNNGAQIQSRSS